jgi:ribonuclease P protein component
LSEPSESAGEGIFPSGRPTAAGRFGDRDRLKTIGEFRRVYNRGFHASSDRIGCYVSPNREARSRLGISVSRKYGSSPERNLVKRRIREAFRRLRHGFPAPLDLVVVPRRAARALSLGGLAAEIDALVRRALSQRRRRS